MSLVPAGAVAPARSYWCTWATQNLGRPFAGVPVAADFEGDTGARAARDCLDEATVFGADGWAGDWPADIRRDLLLMLDDGWDVPHGAHPAAEIWRFGELAPDPVRFPGCAGDPAARLAALVQLARAAGWAGLGIWVACQAPGDGSDGADLPAAALEAAWRERLRWSARAGVAYWKVDWGRRTHDHEARALLSRLARSEAPGLVIEHAWCCMPLNAWEGDGRVAGDPHIAGGIRRPLAYSEVVRAYDVLAHLPTATMLDRLAILLGGSPTTVLINGEDEAYLAATLGCTLGVMRSRRWREVPGVDTDPGDLRLRCGESVRALRWLRCAPPVPAGALPMAVASATLGEGWQFRRGETWLERAIGRTVEQYAPAVVARGCALPEVVPCGEAPFVVAMRHPNGCQAVAALPRTLPRRPARVGLAAVAVPAPPPGALQAVFGCFAHLDLFTPHAAGARVEVQDLAGETVEDVSAAVERLPDRIRLPGALIATAGTAAEVAGGRSQPGLVLRLAGG